MTVKTADPGGNMEDVAAVSRVVSPVTAARVIVVRHPGTLISESYVPTVGALGVVTVP